MASLVHSFILLTEGTRIGDATFSVLAKVGSGKVALERSLTTTLFYLRHPEVKTRYSVPRPPLLGMTRIRVFQRSRARAYTTRTQFYRNKKQGFADMCLLTLDKRTRPLVSRALVFSVRCSLSRLVVLFLRRESPLCTGNACGLLERFFLASAFSSLGGQTNELVAVQASRVSVGLSLLLLSGSRLTMSLSRFQ